MIVVALQTIAIGVLFAIQLRTRGPDSPIRQGRIPVLVDDTPFETDRIRRETERMRSDLEQLKWEAEQMQRAATRQAIWDR